MEEAEKMIGLAAHEMERRGMPRCVVDEEATLVVVSRGLTIPGRLIELSASGCRITLKEKLAQGMHAAVETIFRIRGIAFRLSGLTEWTAGSNTVGVSFGPMSARRRDDLLEVLCEVEVENAAKTAGEGGAPDAGAADAAAASGANLRPALVARHSIAKPESLQLLNAVLRKVTGAGSPRNASNGVPTLPAAVGLEVAAKNGAAGESGAETAALTQPPTETESEARPGSRRDRRTEARCNVDSSVLIRLVKVASRLGGQILDLSLGGCRIHTVERFPVGIYTRVEIEFRLQGTALLLGGVVQAIHGRNEVGIRFLDVSPRKRELLAELIEEIREMRGSD
jgi:PilZ domain-containing protein